MACRSSSRQKSPSAGPHNADSGRLKVFRARGSSACRLSSSVTSRRRAVTALALGRGLAAGAAVPAGPAGRPEVRAAGSPGIWREGPAVPSARRRGTAAARSPAAWAASRHRIAAVHHVVHAPPSPKTVLPVPSASGRRGNRCGPQARSNPWDGGQLPGGGGGPARVRPVWRTVPGGSRQSAEAAGTAVRWGLRLPGARSRDTSGPGRNSRSPLLRELA